MKMPWVPGLEEPRPGFDMYEDENIQPPFNPLESLMLELSEGEYAEYTFHEVYPGCQVRFTAMSRDGGSAEIYVNGVLSGVMHPDVSLSETKETFELPAGDECVIRIAGSRGHVTLKTVCVK